MGSPGRKQYTRDFKREAVRLVTEQGYSVAEAAMNLGVNAGVFGAGKPNWGGRVRSRSRGNSAKLMAWNRRA